MKQLIKLTFLATLILCFTATSQAQSKISPEKEKLIAELIKVTKADTQIYEITDGMLASMEQTYPVIVAKTLESEDRLTDSEKAELSKRMMDSYRSFSKKFRERLPDAVNYEQYIKDAMYPLYDKFFNEKELNDLLTFYKTETGQKVVVSMPQLLVESNQLAEKILLPKVLGLIDEILREETKLIEDSFKNEIG